VLPVCAASSRLSAGKYERRPPEPARTEKKRGPLSIRPKPVRRSHDSNKNQRFIGETTTMATKIFVNVSVKDLKRTQAFFAKLGYTYNAQFTNDDAACMVISEDIFAMLLTEGHFKQFTTKPIADATKTTETIIALSHDSKEAVQAIVEKAFAAGAKRYAEPNDHGFMYQWGFEDLDGHIWEHFWMDPSAVQQ
jgi:uncharacterized protein